MACEKPPLSASRESAVLRVAFPGVHRIGDPACPAWDSNEDRIATHGSESERKGRASTTRKIVCDTQPFVRPARNRGAAHLRRRRVSDRRSGLSAARFEGYARKPEKSCGLKARLNAMKFVGFLLASVGSLVLLLGAWYVVEAVRFIAGTEATRGVVVEHKFTHGLNLGNREVGFNENQTQTTDMYAPIVEFETPRGEKVRFQANWSEGEPPPVGTELGVRFPDERPGDARVAGVSSLFGGAAIVLLLGAIIGGAGLLILRR